MKKKHKNTKQVYENSRVSVRLQSQIKEAEFRVKSQSTVTEFRIQRQGTEFRIKNRVQVRIQSTDYKDRVHSESTEY